MNSTYTILYRNACFTIVMFFFPFITLTWVNCKIVSTLKRSNMIRRRMTNQQGSLTTETPIILTKDTKDASFSRDSVGNASVTRMSLITRKLSKQDLNGKLFLMNYAEI
uniref:Uncharacterized protein n=1 Tax=Panagrolaimus sp. PS1159 TaxID=55785 RepID=A0AC35F6E6_9BILA